MWWWRKRKWDCVSGINSYITDKKKKKKKDGHLRDLWQDKEL